MLTELLHHSYLSKLSIDEFYIYGWTRQMDEPRQTRVQDEYIILDSH